MTHERGGFTPPVVVESSKGYMVYHKSKEYNESYKLAEGEVITRNIKHLNLQFSWYLKPFDTSQVLLYLIFIVITL